MLSFEELKKLENEDLTIHLIKKDDKYEIIVFSKKIEKNIHFDVYIEDKNIQIYLEKHTNSKKETIDSWEPESISRAKDIYDKLIETISSEKEIQTNIEKIESLMLLVERQQGESKSQKPEHVNVMFVFKWFISLFIFGGFLSLLEHKDSLLYWAATILLILFLTLKIKDVRNISVIINKTIVKRTLEANELVYILKQWSRKTRIKGVIALDSEKNKIRDPYLYRGLNDLLDGLDREGLKSNLENAIKTFKREEENVIRTVNKMVISILSGGMVTSLFMYWVKDIFTLTPFFVSVSIVLIVFIPLTYEVVENYKKELIYKEVTMHGLILILEQDSPILLERRLLYMLEEDERQKYIEKYIKL